MVNLILVGSAQAVVGLAGYGFLAVAGHTLGPDGAAAAAAFYLVLGIAGPGVFTGLEQETSRSASAWLARGGAVGDVGRRAALVGAGLLALAVAALLVLGDRVFAGQPGLVGPAVVGVVGAALVYLVRGLLAGMRRFTGYAATLAAEGLSRVALVAAVALSGTADATTYALVFALGLVFAAAAGLPWLRPGTPAPDEPRDTASAMARRAGLLVAAGFGVQAVANLAPIIVTGRLTRDTATAAAFAAAFVLVRIPVLLFTTAQVTMLPALTRAAAAGDRSAPRRAGRALGLAVAGLGVPAVVLAYAVGGEAVRFLFGAQVLLPGWLMAVLALSSLLLMAAHVLQALLVAVGGHRAVALAWITGAGALAGTILVPGDPIVISAWAQLGACALVVAVMVGTLVTTGGRAAVPERPTPGYGAWSRRPL